MSDSPAVSATGIASQAAATGKAGLGFLLDYGLPIGGFFAGLGLGKYLGSVIWSTVGPLVYTSSGSGLINQYTVEIGASIVALIWLGVAGAAWAYLAGKGWIGKTIASFLMGVAVRVGLVALMAWITPGPGTPHESKLWA